MRPTWHRVLLGLVLVGYITVLLVFPPEDSPTVASLTIIPLVVAGSLFGLKVALVVMAFVVVATGLVFELAGPGVASILATYRGVPLLMFALTGIVVGRLGDRLGTRIAGRTHRRRFRRPRSRSGCHRHRSRVTPGPVLGPERETVSPASMNPAPRSTSA